MIEKTKRSLKSDKKKDKSDKGKKSTKSQGQVRRKDLTLPASSKYGPIMRLHMKENQERSQIDIRVQGKTVVDVVLTITGS